MKKTLSIIAVLILLVSAAVVYAASYRPYSFPFIGRWQPSEDPLLLDDFGLQDIQNMRRDGKRLKGVAGDSQINTTAWDATYYFPKSGFHFVKDHPIESHLLIQGFNEAGTGSRIYQNKTAVPKLGNFETTTLHADTVNADKGRFSPGPGGHVVYCNQKESRIWGGDEMKIAGFYLHHAPFTDTPADYWEQVLIDDSDTYVVFGGATTFYVGSNRRINQAKIYVKTANTTASTLGVSEYTYPGASWNGVAGLSDGTATGGIAIAQTGVVSWTYNTATRATFVEDTDILAYWYKFEVIGGADDTTAIYYVTVGEGQFRHIENLWDGALLPPARVWVFDNSASSVTDFTDEVQDAIEITYADLVNFQKGDALIIGSPVKLRGLSFSFVDDYRNAVASVSSVSWWTGTDWTAVTGYYDGTENTIGSAWARNGWAHWMPTEEQSAVSGEAKRTYESNDLLYYYQVSLSVTPSARVKIWYLDTIPAQPAKGDYKLVDHFRFPVLYQNRLFMIAHEDEGNISRYSAFGTSDVFNGEDTGTLTFGDRQKLTAAGVIYNVFRTSGFEQLILTKSSETFRLFGNGPENWELQQMSSNIGCVAPQSFTVCELTDISSEEKRNVAIWQAAHGFVRCDGATIQDISDDIKIYFDKSSVSGIAEHRIDDTYAWYDPDNHTYHALISSGADVLDDWGDDDIWDNEPVEEWGINWEESILTHNLELEYSLVYNEWTKIDRRDGTTPRPLQAGFQTKDTDGKVYTYGAANDGFLYHLEYGRTWNGTPIQQIAWTKDMLLDEEGGKPLFNFTTIEKMRLLFRDKPGSVAPAENIMITHYGDSQQSPVTVGYMGQFQPSGVTMADTEGRAGQTVKLGPFLKHSFKFECSTSNVSNGMELVGMGLYYTPEERWRD